MTSLEVAITCFLLSRISGELLEGDGLKNVAMAADQRPEVEDPVEGALSRPQHLETHRNYRRYEFYIPLFCSGGAVESTVDSCSER